MHKIQISHEVPLALLNESCKWNDYQYALVHLFEKYPAYKRFFENYPGRVILDNSLFELEKPFNLEEFAQYIKGIKPEEYIIPDVLDDAAGTIERVHAWKRDFKDKLSGTAIAVVQGSTYEELSTCFRFYMKSSGVDKIAISFNSAPFGEKGTESYESDCGINRYAFLLGEWRWGEFVKPIHLLGCALPQDFRFYLNAPFRKWIDTVDTSNPVVHGLQGITYTPLGLETKFPTKLHEMMEVPILPAQQKLIEYNVHRFKEFVNGKTH